MIRKSKGFTLVELMIVLAIIAIVATLAIVNLSSSEKAANETAAIKALQSVLSAETEHKRMNQVFADLAGLVDASGNPRVPQIESGSDKGYNFTITAVGDKLLMFEAFAEPIEPTVSGDSTYYTNETGMVWKNPLGGGNPSPAAGSRGTPGEDWEKAS